ncbi:MAG TPA: hypothetical protein VHY91_19965 [Pirellulales bacterium]|nr:hypothetical protein [Pirellulales bacterium]
MNKHDRNATDQLRDKVGDVRQNLRDIGSIAQDAAKEKVTDLRDTVSQQAADLREATNRKAEDLRTRAGEFCDEGRQRAVEFERTLEQRIREKPLQSVAIAAGVGILLGMLWIRR